MLFIYAFMNILSYRGIDIKCFIFIAVGFVKEISETENGSFLVNNYGIPDRVC